MTNDFAYDPLDLENRTFRLVRLGKGQTGDPIQCELFHAYVGDREDDMEYEALSYTWGGMDKPCSISMNNQVMCITSNLFQALEHLRNDEEDRVLWIDALCIDQENPKERGHQVRQMASIYERARQVIFWLGTATHKTDRAFSYMREFEKEALKYSCNYWEPSDERWQIIWSTVETQLQKEYSLNKVMQRTDYDALLNRDWFDRIWIIQEVAKARSARVVCGTKSVSTRVFALFPSLIGVQPTPHRQAVLDIMPGPLRKFSWWLWDQNLETLLRKFQGSKATDPRDMVYALLGISTDANNTKALASDYSKTPGEVARTTIAFL
ncbi:HET-domain-containing protein, partial [Macroventuria anomochaeta]